VVPASPADADGPAPDRAPIDPTSAEAFARLARACGIGPGEAARLHADLVARHAEPHRRHHVLAHVGAVLHHLDVTAAGLDDQRAVRLAAWYHDAVYDQRRADNEEASARLAAAELSGAGVDGPLVADVERLVRVTAGHRPRTADERALCDADLAVLAADREGYERYRSGVREEYDFVADATWRVGRARVLEGLLDGPLFHTEAFADREGRARENLLAELRTLAG